MSKALAMLAIAAPLSACSAAKATVFDAANPLHCLIAFETYSTLAKRKGDMNVSRGFAARAQWYANRVPAKTQVPDELVEEYLALSDGGLALSTACMERQDADPSFAARLKR